MCEWVGVRINPTVSFNYHPPLHQLISLRLHAHTHTGLLLLLLLSTSFICPRFQARIKFPVDYPYSPPAFRFLTKMWHPNIYEVEHTHTHTRSPPLCDEIAVKNLPCSPQNGDVCISILHPPVDDPQSGELPSERWNPTQNVRYLSSLHSFRF